MHIVKSLPWCCPLDLSCSIDEPYWVLLYSGDKVGRYSYLAHRLEKRIEAENFNPLSMAASNDRALFDNAWFGYLGYGLKNSLESLKLDKPSWLAMPELCMMRFHAIYQFDHEKRTITLWADDDGDILIPKKLSDDEEISVTSLRSNMSKETYLENVSKIIEHIHEGDLYQANLTRKFSGDFKGTPNGFSLFRLLCKHSPAAYSSYIRLDNRHIISSSPELFLRASADGKITTRPIKGTSPRYKSSDEDKKSYDHLKNSEKDRAENLMIVDLMRHDLAKTCLTGSVKTESLFDVTSHTNIHHMSSSISGQKHPNFTIIDSVRGCFPPGSMTGAPKIRAMDLCSNLEKDARGVYGGAIGWFGGDGSCELSVVIRTLLMQDNKFEFQVGGGIVADSTPQGELEELIHKARGLCTILGISPQKLAKL